MKKYLVPLGLLLLALILVLDDYYKIPDLIKGLLEALAAGILLLGLLKSLQRRKWTCCEIIAKDLENRQSCARDFVQTNLHKSFISYELAA